MGRGGYIVVIIVISLIASLLDNILRKSEFKFKNFLLEMLVLFIYQFIFLMLPRPNYNGDQTTADGLAVGILVFSISLYLSIKTLIKKNKAGRHKVLENKKND